MSDALRIPAYFMIAVAIVVLPMPLIRGSSAMILTATCEARGHWGRYEEWILGKRFWDDQFEHLRAREASVLKEYGVARENWESTLHFLRSEHENVLKSYQRYPEMRLTPETITADRLRLQADELDALEAYKRRVAEIDREIGWVRKCTAKIAERKVS